MELGRFECLNERRVIRKTRNGMVELRRYEYRNVNIPVTVLHKRRIRRYVREQDERILSSSGIPDGLIRMMFGMKMVLMFRRRKRLSVPMGRRGKLRIQATVFRIRNVLQVLPRPSRQI